MHWWMVGAAANLVILFAYMTISGLISRGLVKTRQGLHDNPLGWATAAIFFTCAVHHGAHPLHQLLPYFGVNHHVGTAMRDAFSTWTISGWDIITAGTAVWYLALRNRFPALVRGAAVFEDIKLRQQQALEIHDNIVQGLATAKISFELDKSEEGMRAVEETLAASRRIITNLLGDEESPAELKPGELRRTAPAKVGK